MRAKVRLASAPFGAELRLPTRVLLSEEALKGQVNGLNSAPLPRCDAGAMNGRKVEIFWNKAACLAGCGLPHFLHVQEGPFDDGQEIGVAGRPVLQSLA